MTNQYASAEETAALTRPATEQEAWLNAQLDRLAPNRHEQGHGRAYTDALVQLVFELRAAQQPIADVKSQAPNMSMYVLASDYQRTISALIASRKLWTDSLRTSNRNLRKAMKAMKAKKAKRPVDAAIAEVAHGINGGQQA